MIKIKEIKAVEEHRDREWVSRIDNFQKKFFEGKDNEYLFQQLKDFAKLQFKEPIKEQELDSRTGGGWLD